MIEAMPPITFVLPTLWDRKQIATAAQLPCARDTVAFVPPDDADCPDDFDVLGFIERMAADPRVRGGVLSSSDYPGAVVAAAIATAAGRPGASPHAVLRCSNKYAARVAMHHAVPQATPRFALVHPPQHGAPVRLVVPDGAEAPAFPLFVKPVKGAFSAHSARVDDAAQLDAFLRRPCLAAYTRDYLRLHHRLQARYAPELVEASAFLVEELLRGDQVTVEGFVSGGTITILGVVDSVFHPGRRSFARFEYPSALPAAAQLQLHHIAQRAIAALGLESCMFNVEMTYDRETARAGILEVNPRMCGQFADLYAKVDGTHGYAVALAVAAGQRPHVRHGAGADAFAASVPLRVFSPVHVRRVPDAADIAAAESLFDGTLVWVECVRGDCLGDFTSIEDGASARYAVVNVGAARRADLPARAEAVAARLRFDLEPVAGASESTRHVSPNS